MTCEKGFCLSIEYNEVCSLFIANQQTIISEQLPANVLDSFFEGSQLVGYSGGSSRRNSAFSISIPRYLAV